MPTTLIEALRLPEALAGSVFLPFTVTMSVMGAYAGKLTDRIGPRLPLTLGAGITGLSFLGVSLERVFFKQLLHELRRRGYNLRYILVIGAGRLARQVLEQVDLHKELGFRAVGCLSLTKKRLGTSVGGVEVIGTIRDLRRVIGERYEQIIDAMYAKE